jgi:hypothetical protein
MLASDDAAVCSNDRVQKDRGRSDDAAPVWDIDKSTWTAELRSELR